MEILLVLFGVFASFLWSYVTVLWNKIFKERNALQIKIGNLVVDIKLNDIEKSLLDLNDALSIQRENPKVFISYASEDKEFARKIVADLKKEGIDTWFDEYELHAGDSIHNKLEEGINSSQWYLQILSPNSIKSEWTTKELEKFIEVEKERKRKMIIPIIKKDTILPEKIRDRIYINLGENYEENILSLIKAIKFKNDIISKKKIQLIAKGDS